MTFEATISTILKWIDSCETTEQLNLCNDAIDVFMISRFRHHIEPFRMSLAESKLLGAFMDKRTFLRAQKSTAPESVKKPDEEYDFGEHGPSFEDEAGIAL
ncbi:MAG TPA: hypothetical protein VK618_06620 [Flavitalea sp.]|nr:hypothetical protein [Flavitalea sp.]